jgi:DEAD/DEAH box helicase domain-containing protein
MIEPKTPLLEFLTAFRKSSTHGHLLADTTILPARSARWAQPPLPLSEVVAHTLLRSGIERLYDHQERGLAAVRGGEDVVVATPTASGKSLVYQLAMLEALAADPNARGLFLYPLKALAQDQLKGFRRLAEAVQTAPKAAIYDGDTPDGARRRIRQQPPAVIFSNPEMLHLSLLAHHTAWSDFWRGLSLVVIDEAHVYRGIVGSHMAAVIQRLLRTAAAYGSRPRFIFTSATIANPDDFCRQLTGRPVTAVTDSGCARTRCHLLMTNTDRGPISMAIDLLLAAMHRRLRTIVFTPSRKMAEQIALAARGRAASAAKRISPYRAGYTPAERRDIEARLARGDLLAVVSTSALELGIDIGELDLCLLVGYPGTRIATRQRAGRVGRRQKASAVILIAGEDALDAYFLRHPEELWSGQTEKAVLNPLNPHILAQHLVCAADELPLKPDEEWLREPAVTTVVEHLRSEGQLRRRADAAIYHASQRHPQRHVHLRAGGRPLAIINRVDGKLIGEVDRHRAARDTHPRAVYLHRGTTYLIESLDLEAGKVTARPERVGYTTRARTQGSTEIVSREREKRIPACVACFGKLKVEDQVVGFERIRRSDGRKLGLEDLCLPPQTIETEGLWFTVDTDILGRVAGEGADVMGALHAAEHLLIALFPLMVLADRNDVGGLSTNFHPQTGQATIFIYDGIPGGAGLCSDAFERLEDLFRQAIDTLASCPCDTGCPACVHSPKCGSGNDPLDKGGARLLLKRLLEPARHLPVDTLQLPTFGPERSMTAGRKPARYGVLDLETRRSAEEVGGWTHSHRMGVSCAVLYESQADEYAVFWEEDMDELLARMARLDLVVGFNLLHFDYHVLKPYLPTAWQPPATLDILDEVHRTLGYRRSLAHLAGETLGAAKTADGLQALRWWHAGRYAELAAYCRQDVAITRDLYRFGCKHGYLLYRDAEDRQMQVPVDFVNSLDPPHIPPTSPA